MGGLISLLSKKEEEQELKRQLPIAEFKMALRYPSYTKAQYEKMSEWEIDVILKQYGLSVDGNLAYKKQFAIGSFVWDQPKTDPSYLVSHDVNARESSSCGLGMEKAATRIANGARSELGLVTPSPSPSRRKISTPIPIPIYEIMSPSSSPWGLEYSRGSSFHPWKSYYYN